MKNDPFDYMRNLNPKNGAVEGLALGIGSAIFGYVVDENMREWPIENFLIGSAVISGLLAGAFSLLGYANQKLNKYF